MNDPNSCFSDLSDSLNSLSITEFPFRCKENSITTYISGDEDDDVEVKQTQVSQYESMQISAILQKNPVDADIDSSTNQESGQLFVLTFYLNFFFQNIHESFLFGQWLHSGRLRLLYYVCGLGPFQLISVN